VVGRCLPGRAVEAKPCEQLAPGFIGLCQQRGSVEPEQVERDVGDRRLGGALADAPCVGQAHAPLQQAKARVALRVEGDDLAVEDELPIGERVADPGELGIARARIVASTGTHARRTPRFDEAHRAHAVPFQLIRPAVAGRQALCRGCEHRLELPGRRHAPDNRRVLFELDGVTLSRAGSEVLADLSAGIPDGTTCLAGPSGSGKSTILRLLNRLADADRGTVRYRGEDVRDRDPLRLRREVCLVPQLPALLQGTVAQNIEFAARLDGDHGEQPDVADLLELAGLDGSYAERDGSRLSVGEQQRVMLARALAVQPKVLLLDEPTSALDERSRDAVEETLRDLAARLELSTVLVTHDIEQARRMSEWLVRIDAGRVVEEGPTVEVLGITP
jgi:putative ABC transport system ATP-binding protein